MRILFLVCCLSALAPGALRATEAPAVPPRVVSLRVLAFEGLVTDLAVRSPQGRARIVARASVFGPGIEALAEDGFVAFFNHAPAPANPGVPETPAASFAVEPDVDRYLVIVAATGRGAERRFSAYAIPDAGETLPPRHARVINFTGGPLAVQLGAGTAVVAAARSAVLPCPPGPDGHADLRLARPAREEGDWELAASTRVAVPEGRRLLLLVTPARPPASAEDGVAMAAGGVFNLRVVFDSPAPVPGPEALAHQTRPTP